MDYSKIRVLVTDGGGKQTLAMIRGLKDIGCHVTVMCTSKYDACYVSKLPDERVITPSLKFDNPESFTKLRDLAASGKYDVLMPIGEMSTNFVTSHEEELGKYVKMACAPRDTYIKAFNKQITFDTALEAGIPCPYTRKSDQSIEDFLENARFPIIIKPRQGLGSIGFHKFKDEEEFRKRLQDPSFDPDDYVIQEFVKFDKRIGTNLFVDAEGNVCTSYAVDVLRWFPIDAGAGVLIQTVDSHESLAYAGELLKKLQWKGFANVAFMLDKETGTPKLLEINGRIPASVKMSYMCGFNVSKQFLQMIYGEPVDRYPENSNFNLYLRHFDTDLAWFFKSPDRFKTRPSWFSWKNTSEILYSRDDRRPFFSNLFHKVFRYRQIMEKKKH